LLSGGVNIWLITAFDWTLIKISKVTCKLLPFFIYAMLDFSVLIIVIMTGEKLYAISRPMNALQTKFNRKRSTIITLVAFLFCLAINSHFLFTHSLIEFKIRKSFNNSRNNYSDKVCTYRIWGLFYDNYWSYIDAIIYSFLPFILLSIFNTSIITRLVKEKQKSLKLQQPENVLLITGNKKCKNDMNLKTSPENKSLTRKPAIVEYNSRNSIATIILAVENQRKKSTNNNNKRLTMTILFINISFCLLTMPIVILQILNQIDINTQISNLKSRNNTKKFENTEDEILNENYFNMIKALFELLQYINHSINFFLYCLCGKTFRNETKQLLSSIFRKNNFIFFKRVH
jgi:hypothetical protein